MDLSALRERDGRRALSVTELNDYIKARLEADANLAHVTVRGEISNFVRHSSGHLYFSLKDEDGQIRAIMFRSSAARLPFVPKDGMKVLATGSISVYTKTGAYQIYVTALHPDGIGDLYLAYEQLKSRLAQEGLFDESHKLPLPEMATTIGVITSPTGAAVRDIIHIAGRRFPMAKIVLYPSLVQGDGAEDNLIRGLQYFEQSRACDCIIIGRGGGSIEDLWAFNGERLARKIYEMTIPVISAVGHETDFTICDFVADLRAPTPSAAAELAVRDVRELYQYLDGVSDRAKAALKKSAEQKALRLSALASRPALRDPTTLFEKRALATADLCARLTYAIDRSISCAELSLSKQCAALQAMSPLAVLERGYSVVRNARGVVRSVSHVSVGENVEIVVSDGKIEAEIKSLNQKEEKK